jgi:hypothetical protein
LSIKYKLDNSMAFVNRCLHYVDRYGGPRVLRSPIRRNNHKRLLLANRALWLYETR